MAHERSRPPFNRSESALPAPERWDRGVTRHRGDFHNPYNFVPAPPRNTDDLDLGDQPPVGQDTYHTDRYSGWIRVRMTAKTPLLVPDTEHMQEDRVTRHKTYPLRVAPDGRPLIPASSVRGMLRSAYEAVTNSRFGCFPFEQHRDRLAFRMEARDGLRLIPARVENGHIRLLTGTSGVGAAGKPNGPVYAAWLPRYHKGEIADNAVQYADGTLPAHGDEVECWVELFRRDRWDREEKRHVLDFQYWKVRQIVRWGEVLDPAPKWSDPSPERVGRPQHQPEGQPLKKVRGWVCVTNANINRKHDERVFFSFSDVTGVPDPFPVTETHRCQWQELIKNYQHIHSDDLEERKNAGRQPDEYHGDEPALSRHVYTLADRDLTDGTLCYVRLNGNQSDVEALFPVMISRELYPLKPWDLLDPSLRPAPAICQLSPADRVFGWVKSRADTETGKRVAVRGLLRVGPVRCESSVADSVASFGAPGVPLAILSAPKPQQGRFYVARSPQGEAQPSRLHKSDAGYSPGKGLRGRKVYPHQRSLPDGYWDHPTDNQAVRGSPGHYQEYSRPEGKRDGQNHSILGWVKPGARFSFDLQVQNLSETELGALLWLLYLPEDHFFRFGGGKPLGFGSVRLQVTSCDLRAGNELLDRYREWHDGSLPGDPRQKAIETFKKALVRAYPPVPSGGFDDIPFIKAFLTACRGHEDNLPTHYPRTYSDDQPGQPNSSGESFKWFVANEKGPQHALADLTSDPGLPILPGRAGSDRGQDSRRDDDRRGGKR